MENKDYDEQQVVEQVAMHLHDKFPDRDPATVEAVASETVHEFADAKVKDYVGPLAEHRARAILHGDAQPAPVE